MHRCPWPSDDPLMISYHDHEWGNPVHNDQTWFEFIVLDAFQAGLSWRTVLYKRESFRKAFEGFDPYKVVTFDEARVAELMADAGIIRNQLKIRATVSNAAAFIRIREEFGSFDSYIWGFTGGKTEHHYYGHMKEVPPRTELSDRISADMVKRGFKFAGSTIVYAFLQAAGVVNDHLTSCFRHGELGG